MKKEGRIAVEEREIYEWERKRVGRGKRERDLEERKGKADIDGVDKGNAEKVRTTDWIQRKGREIIKGEEYITEQIRMALNETK